MSMRPYRTSAIALALIPVCLFSVAAQEPATFHVSLDGADGHCATLARAIEASRPAGPDTPKRIVLSDGRHFVEETVILSPQDANLTIEAAPGAEPVLCGGRRVDGWQRDGDAFWSVALPEVADGSWDFRALVVNGRMPRRARLPEEGRYQHESAFDVRWMSTTGGGWERKPTDEELTTMVYKEGDLGPWLTSANAEVTVYHMWDESLVGVAALDAEKRTLTFSSPCGHPPGAFRVKDYVVWNVREGMTKPGQWYLDRAAGKVVYWPLPGEDLEAADVYAPTTECILKVQGTESARIQNVTVRGLALTVTTTPLKAGGFGAGKFEGALSAYWAENCHFLDLTIFNVGGQGIRTWECNHSIIQGCDVHHTGACGMMPRGSALLVADNAIHDIGILYPSAIGLTSGGGGEGVRVLHNVVYNTPYSAITAGGDNHVVEGNRIHHAMQELHDGAAIYVGFGKNVVLRGNYVSDIVNTGGYGASAYYLDEQAKGYLVEGNLSVNVGWPSHNHMAKGNTIRNNVFVVDGDAQLTFPKSLDYVFEKNIVQATGSITFTNPSAIATFTDNILFSGSDKVIGVSLDAYRKTGESPLEFDATNTDPGLLGVESGTVRFAENSPAPGLGIQPIDVSDAGPRPAEKRNTNQ
ncbi:MAG: right-handed parallel beta-helix repeat-containing protein [bacterium]|nr:right-handed parallel beta-helix repeat-containing protein [bacterium]